MKELKIFALLFVSYVMVGHLQTFAQDVSQNYIKKTTYRDAINKSITIDYIDGLGKTSETVSVGLTPTHNDIKQFFLYDAFGNIATKSLPIPCNAQGETVPEIYNETKLDYETKYDATSRVTEERGPGLAWETNKKYVKHELLTNDQATLSCIKFSLSEDNRIKKEGIYSTGVMYVEKTTDEDKKVAYKFTNMLKQCILQRQIDNGQNHDTYYIYDKYGNLSYVLPPLCSDYFIAVSNFATTGVTYTVNDYDNDFHNLKKYAYYYSYDKWNRCIEKKLPGVEPIYMVYDNADRLKFTQDGNQRANGIWMFNKYDAFGRVVISGTYTPTTIRNRPYLQTILETETNLNDSFDTLCTNYYTNTSFPRSDYTALIVNYYEDYDFYLSRRATLPSNFRGQMAIFKPYYPNPTNTLNKCLNYGYLTGRKVAMLDNTSKYLWQGYIYNDINKEPSKTVSTNLLDKVEIEEVEMDYTGAVLSKKITHSTPSYETITEYYTNTYDHAGRLTETKHHINTGANVSLIKSQYNELGQLVKQTSGGNLNEQNYEYNIRNWITSNSGKYFKENLYYEKTRGNGTGLFNGNICQTDITYPGNNYSMFYGSEKYDLMQQGGINVGYNYTYDNLNRLRKRQVPDFFDLFGESITYDKQGNILFMKRGGIYEHAWLDDGATLDHSLYTIDDLIYTYNGNQLKKVLENNVDEPTFTGSQYFVDRVNVADEYFYDANGNMTADLNKDIVTIKYNLLNLPEVVQFRNGNMVSYSYDATGIKHKVSRSTKTNASATLDVGQTLNSNPSWYGITTAASNYYYGNTFYEGTKLSKIILPNGLLIRSNSLTSTPPTFAYNHYVKDYLGNVRIVFDNTGTIKQINNYYPFGMEQGEFAEDQSVLTYQDYLLGGKEFDRKNEMNTYDFGARSYDGTLGRWTSVDPLAEKYYSTSPYAYCANNPILLIDPTGLGCTYNPYTQQYYDENGNEVDWEDAKNEITERYSIAKKETISYLENLQTSVTGLYNQIQSVATGLFSLVSEREQTTLPSGEQTTKYKQRDLSPDYVSANLSLDCFFVTGYGLDISLGYVRNDGLFLLGCYRQGTGFDLSIAGGLSLGLYTGKTNPIALSLSGLGAFQNIGYGNLSIGSSQNILADRNTLSIGSEWLISNAAYGLGAFPQSFNLGISKTTQPLYLLKR